MAVPGEHSDNNDLDKFFRLIVKLQLIVDLQDFEQLAVLLRDYNFLDKNRRNNGLIALLNGFDQTHLIDIGDNPFNFAQKKALLALRDTLRQMDYTLTPDYKKGKDRYEEFAGQLISRLHRSSSTLHSNVQKDANWSRQKQSKITFNVETKPIGVPDAASNSSASQTFAYHQATVSAIALSPDGRTVASGDHFGTVFVWDLNSGKPKIPKIRADQRRIGDVAFMKDGTLLTGGSGGALCHWNVTNGYLLRTLVPTDKNDSVTEFFAWLKDNPVTTDDASFFASEMKMAKNRADGLAINCIRPQEDGTVLVAYEDGQVRNWDMRDGSYLGRHAKSLKGEALCTATAKNLFISGDEWTVVGGENGISIKQSGDSDSYKVNFENCYDVTAVTFIPNQQILACGLTGSSEGSIALVPITKRVLHQYSRIIDSGEFGTVYLKDPVRNDGVHSLATTPNGRYLLSVDHKGKTSVWNWQQRKLVHQFKSGPVCIELAIAVTPDGSTVLTGGTDNRIKKWSLASL